LLCALNIFILTVVALYYRRFLALCFDEEQALLQGVRVKRLYMILLSLVAISIVLLMQVIGTILVLTLLTLPALLASLFTQRLYVLMGVAALFSALFSTFGLSVAHVLDLPPGACITLVAALSYLGLLSLKKKSFSLKRKVH
jgi:zinc transport system permease protein